MVDDTLKYSEGFMNEEEKEAFEQKMENSEELREEYELNQSLDKFLVKQVELEEIKSHVALAFDEVAKEGTTTVRTLYIKWASIAASLLITVMVSSTIVRNSASFIYKQNFELYAPTKITRGSENNEKLIYLTGLYVKQQFQEVVSTYNELPHAIAMDPTVSIMYGCALMELESFDKALLTFERIDASKSSLMRADVQWYKGLCYVRLKEYAEAKTYFSVLLDNKKYADRARKIVAKLD